MTIRPIGEHILLEALSREEREGKTTSGIIIPDTAEKERSEEGRVIALGEGRLNKEGVYVPFSVKVGDRVVFSKYGPHEIKIANKEYLIAKEDDILGVVEN